MFSFVVKQPSPKMFVFGVNYFGKYIYDYSKKSFLRDNYNDGFQHVFTCHLISWYLLMLQ